MRLCVLLVRSRHGLHGIAPSSNTRSPRAQIGATVGFYTLLAATRGYDVISIEPVHESVIRILYSLQGNDVRIAATGTDVATGTGATRKPVVYVLENAAMDAYNSMNVQVIKDNVGASFVTPSAASQAVNSGKHHLQSTRNWVCFATALLWFRVCLIRARTFCQFVPSHM